MTDIQDDIQVDGAQRGLSKTLYIAPNSADAASVPQARTMDSKQLIDAMLCVKQGESNICVCMDVKSIDILRKCIRLIPLKIIAVDGLESPVRASEWALTTDFLDHVSVLELQEQQRQDGKKKAISGQKTIFDLPKRGYNIQHKNIGEETADGNE